MLSNALQLIEKQDKNAVLSVFITPQNEGQSMNIVEKFVGTVAQIL